MGKIAPSAAAGRIGGTVLAQGRVAPVTGGGRLAVESSSIAQAIASGRDPFFTVHTILTMDTSLAMDTSGAGLRTWAEAHNGLEVAAVLCDRAPGAPQGPAVSSGESLPPALDSIGAAHLAAITLNGDSVTLGACAEDQTEGEDRCPMNGRFWRC